LLLKIDGADFIVNQFEQFCYLYLGIFEEERLEIIVSGVSKH
jgi:hypothetical protein